MSERRLDGVAALMAAETTAMRKLKGERDTEFVKRIVSAYLDAEEALARGAAEAAQQRVAWNKAKTMLKELGY